MGAESSILEDCEWEESTQDGLWSLSHGRLADGNEISRFTVAQKGQRHEDLLRKLIKNLKSIRHPSILTYVCSEEESDGPQLATEKAVPLESVIESLSSTEICAGLHTVLDALQFLHEKVGANHNNVNIGSVYVTSDGSWRLGGLEHLCKFSEASSTFLQSSKTYRHEPAIAPEEKEGKVSTDASLGHTRDVYAFAVMTESLLEQMEDLGDFLKTFELRIQDECLNRDPRNRPKVQSLLCDRLFNTDFLEIALFLKNVTLKTEEERASFFKNLLPRLQKQPEELVARRLVPGLLSRFVFLDQSAVENVLPSLLTPKKDGCPPNEFPPESVPPLLSEEICKKYVVPKLVKIISVRDYHIHILLLQYFHHYVHLINKEDLELDVFPQVLLGLRDSSDLIASLSLHALAEMAPILGRDVVIGGKSKQYFKDGKPKSHSEAILPIVNNKQSQVILPIVNNKQSHVRGVMGKMKLIDLAKQSEKGIPAKVKAEDSDQRWKEREQRREEMKRKREEMKRKREEMKLARQKSNSESKEIVNSADSPTESPEKMHEDINNTDHGDVFQNDDNIKDIQKSEDIEDEMEKSDWSGWSENEADADYSDEIEKELEDMNIYAVSNVSPDVHSDNAEKSSHSKGSAMKLVFNKKSGKKTSENANKENSEGLEIAKDEKPVTKSPKSNIPATTKQKLGSEFDIMNLDIKTSKGKDVDFFADMTPAIEAKPANLMDMLNGGDWNDSTTESKDAKKTQKKFNVEVQDTEVDGETGGWGDDDW